MIKTEETSPGLHEAFSDDPVIAMLGVGKHLWQDEPGDRFVERLRREDAQEAPSPSGSVLALQQMAETIWRRIERHQGEVFHTARRLPLTYQVESAGIWFYRDGQRVNRKLMRNQVEVAISRCPLQSTTEIKDLMDYPYLFALLTDPRIKGEDW